MRVPPARTTYRIVFETGDVLLGGTDANVFLSLAGSTGSSIEKRLETDEDTFVPGSAVVFRVETQDMGDIERIRVRHDNTGLNAGWFLHRVVITNELTGREWVFNCDRWLAMDEDDGAIDRVLYPRV